MAEVVVSSSGWGFGALFFGFGFHSLVISTLLSYIQGDLIKLNLI